MKVITSHINLDFDGYAACCLLTLFFRDYNLVFPGSKENKVNLFVKQNLNLLPKELKLPEIRKREITHAVVVDTSSCNRLGELCKKIEKVDKQNIFHFDHHFANIDPVFENLPNGFLKKRASTTTIVVEFLKEKNIEIPPFLATLGVIGIYEDTDFLSFAETTYHDIDAVSHLVKCGAKVSEAVKYIKTPLSDEQIELLNSIIPRIERMTVKGREIALVQLSLERFYPDVSAVMHRVMELEAIKFFVAILQMEKKVYLMAKNDYEDLDLQAIFSGFKGGGHKNVFTAVYKNKTVFEIRKEVEKSLKNIPAKTSCISIASEPIAVLSEEDTVNTAFKLINKVKVNSLPVKNIEGEYIGYVLRQDIDYAYSKGLENLKIKNLCNRDLITIDGKEDIEEAKRLFLKTGAKLVFVKNNGKIAGIITRTGAFKHFAVIREIGESGINLKDRLKENLPREIYSILEEASLIAGELNVEVYIVGGFVRDLLLKKRNFDLDFVVSENGIEFAKALGKKLNGRVVAHEKFKTAVIVSEDRDLRIDVATLRFEYYDSPGDLPRIVKATLFHDLYRRDFTINAMAINLTKQRFGELVDYFNGRRDLKDKIIRVLHSLSFIDDPTRILRALRFKHRFNFKIGKTTESLMLSAAEMNIFENISGWRYLKEFKALFSEKNASFILNDFEKYGCVKFFGNNLKIDDYIKTLSLNIDSVLTWYSLLYKNKAQGWLLYLMAIFIHLNREQREKLAVKLSLKKREKKIIADYKRFLREYSLFAKWKERKISEYYHFFKGEEIEILLFALAFFEDENYRKFISLYIDKYMDFKLKISGRDVIKLGVKEGIEVKKILEEVESEVIDNNILSEIEQKEILQKVVSRFKRAEN